MDPSQPFQDHLKQFLPEQQVVTVLDVGAGPLTLLGKKLPGKELVITAVDPLAAEYDVILRKYGIVPPVRTQYALAERLSDIFPENTFDFVHICNALDHNYDPIAGIKLLQHISSFRRHHVNLSDFVAVSSIPPALPYLLAIQAASLDKGGLEQVVFNLGCALQNKFFSYTHNLL